MQTIFHRETQHGFFGSVGKCYTYKNIIFTIVGTIGCVMSGTWCQNVWHQNGDPAGPNTYQLLRL